MAPRPVAELAPQGGPRMLRMIFRRFAELQLRRPVDGAQQAPIRVMLDDPDNQAAFGTGEVGLLRPSLTA